MVLAQKQTGRPMDSNRRPRHESMLPQLTDFQERSSKYTMEKRQPLQQMLLGNWISTSYLLPCTKINSK
jgi:hypothetical protein